MGGVCPKARELLFHQRNLGCDEKISYSAEQSRSTHLQTNEVGGGGEGTPLEVYY